jgi:hypothetical protein
MMVAAVVGILALALATPATSFAAPAPSVRKPAVVVPDGSALMHIQSATSKVERLGRPGLYRITLAMSASITWLARASGRERVGTFTARALKQAWHRMGYGNGVRASTTLVWGSDAASRRTNHRLALLSHPRLTRHGNLTFIAVTIGGAFPKWPQNLNVHISRADGPRLRITSGASGITRAYAPTDPLTFAPFNIDTAGTAQVQGSSDGNITGTVTWPATTGTNPCRGPINATADASGQGIVNFQGFACGNGDASRLSCKIMSV